MTKEKKAYCHVDSHVIAIVHVMLESLSHQAECSEAINISAACHDHAHSE